MFDDTTHPVEDRLRERVRVDALRALYVNTYDGDVNDLDAFIAWASYYVDPAFVTIDKQQAFIAEFAKYLSFSTSIVDVPYVALKPTAGYANVAVAEDKFIDNLAILTLKRDSGSFTSVNFSSDRSTSICNGSITHLGECYSVLCESTLEKKFYRKSSSSSLLNVDMEKLIPQLRTLMIAAGWNETTYTNNEWVQAESAYSLFAQKLSQLQQANPIPQSFTEEEALAFIAQAQRNGISAYAEYYSSQGEWRWLMHDRYFVIAQYGSIRDSRSNVFTGIVGSANISTRANPKFFVRSLTDLTICPASVYAVVQFEAQSLGHFYEQLTSHRQNFLLIHYREFNTA